MYICTYVPLYIQTYICIMCKDLVIIAAKTNTKNAARNEKAKFLAPLGNGTTTWSTDKPTAG